MTRALVTRMILHGVGYLILAMLVLTVIYGWGHVAEWVATYVFPFEKDINGEEVDHPGWFLIFLLILVLLPACFIGGAVQAYNNHWQWKEKRQREANRKAESNGV